MGNERDDTVNKAKAGFEGYKKKVLAAEGGPSPLDLLEVQCQERMIAIHDNIHMQQTERLNKFSKQVIIRALILDARENGLSPSQEELEAQADELFENPYMAHVLRGSVNYPEKYLAGEEIAESRGMKDCRAWIKDIREGNVRTPEQIYEQVRDRVRPEDRDAFLRLCRMNENIRMIRRDCAKGPEELVRIFSDDALREEHEMAKGVMAAPDKNDADIKRILAIKHEGHMPRALDRIYFYFLDHTDSEQAEKENSEIISKLCSPKPEYDEYRKEFLCRIINESLAFPDEKLCPSSRGEAYAAITQHYPKLIGLFEMQNYLGTLALDYDIPQQYVDALKHKSALYQQHLSQYIKEAGWLAQPRYRECALASGLSRDEQAHFCSNLSDSPLSDTEILTDLVNLMDGDGLAQEKEKEQPEPVKYDGLSIRPEQIRRTSDIKLAEREKAEADAVRTQQEAIRERTVPLSKEAAMRAVEQAFDTSRLGAKATLAFLTDPETGAYTLVAKRDHDLKKIVDKLRQYAQMDATAVSGDYEAEQKLIRDIQKRVDKYAEKLEKEEMKNNLTDSEEGMERYLTAHSLKNFLDGQVNGLLSVSIDADPEPIEIDAADPSPEPGEFDSVHDASDMPLFPHDPCPSDIRQASNLGNCYMAAALATLSARFPDAIRRCMADNGDGTVTARLYTREVDENTGELKNCRPVLITDKKKYFSYNNASKSLWEQMLEILYTKSGMHLDSGMIESRPITNGKKGEKEDSKETIQERYQKYLRLQKEGKPLPTHEEDPWLIDEENSLRPWKPTLKMIESGNSDNFLALLLGPDCVQHKKLNVFDYHGTVSREKFQTADTAQYVRRSLFSLTSEKTRYSAQPITEDVNREMRDFAAMLFDKAPKTLSGGEEDLGKALYESMSLLASNAAPGTDPDTAIGNIRAALLKALSGGITPADAAPEGPYGPAGAKLMSVSDLAVQAADKDALAARLGAAFDNLQNGLDRKPYSGRYSKEEEKLLSDIQYYIDEGALLNFGTSGDSDRVNQNGLLGKHAYSLLGITKHALYEGGPELTFIQARNPHGKTGRKYEVDPVTHAVKPVKESCEATGGVFEVELGDLYRESDIIMVNSLSDKMLAGERDVPPEVRERREKLLQERRERDAKKAAEKEAEKAAAANAPGEKVHRLSYREIGELMRPLRASGAALKGTDGILSGTPSAEYKQFVDYYKIVLGPRAFHTHVGRPLSEVSGYYKRLADLGEKYLEHCSRVPRSGNRRETRVKEITRVTNLARAYETGKEPTEYVKGKLAEDILKEIVKAKLAKIDDTDLRKKIEKSFHDVKSATLDQLRNNDAFKQMVNGKSFNELSDMTICPRRSYHGMLRLQNGMLERERTQAAQTGAPVHRELSAGRNNAPRGISGRDFL